MVKINYTHLTLVSMQCYLIYHHCRHQWIMLPGKEIPIIHIDVLPVGSLRNGSRLVCLYRRALSWRARTEATVPSHCPPQGEAKVDKKWTNCTEIPAAQVPLALRGVERGALENLKFD